MAGDRFHFLKESRVGADFPAFVFYAEFLKFGFRIFAPRAPFLNVKNRGHEEC